MATNFPGIQQERELSEESSRYRCPVSIDHPRRSDLAPIDIDLLVPRASPVRHKHVAKRDADASIEVDDASIGRGRPPLCHPHEEPGRRTGVCRDIADLTPVGPDEVDGAQLVALEADRLVDALAPRSADACPTAEQCKYRRRGGSPHDQPRPVASLTSEHGGRDPLIESGWRLGRWAGEDEGVGGCRQLFHLHAAGGTAVQVVEGGGSPIAGKDVKGDFVDHVGDLGAREGSHRVTPIHAGCSISRARTVRSPRRMRVLAVPTGMLSKTLISCAVCPKKAARTNARDCSTGT
jgi:hypothetical protein